MADNDTNNDEYQFQDLNEVSPEPLEESITNDEKPTEAPSEASHFSMPQNQVTRSRVFYVAGFVLLLITGKVLYSIFTHKHQADIASVQPVMSTANTSPPIQPAFIPQESQLTTNPVVDSATNDQLASLEINHKAMQADIMSINSQLDQMNHNSSDISARIDAINQSIVQLSTNLEQQSAEIQHLMQMLTPKKAVKKHNVKPVAKPMQYYVEAIIPGRAWLIASNGSTRTVREGTILDSYYGTVKLIDAPQGRVTTSHGQIFRFSQEDS